jgi:hypothetical protein
MFARNPVVSLNHGDAKSPPESSPKVETVAREDLVNWFQEHSALCSAVASENQWNPETHARWKECLLASTQKGRRLIQGVSSENMQSVLSKFQEVSSTQFAASQSSPSQFMPVAGSMRGKAGIPLSGFRRFDEQISQQQNRMPQAPAVGMASQVTGAYGPAAVTLVPSRTYIKKTGNS